MGLEIERKFLVVGDAYRSMASRKQDIEQGYLSVFPRATVRLRIIDHKKAFLTIKSANKGATRHEWEYELPYDDAQSMMDNLPVSGYIAKTRYNVGRWEVDEFHGRLEGLNVAEIELDDENEQVELPVFVGREVTHDQRYYNSSLGDCSEIPPIS